MQIVIPENKIGSESLTNTIYSKFYIEVFSKGFPEGETKEFIVEDSYEDILYIESHLLNIRKKLVEDGWKDVSVSVKSVDSHVECLVALRVTVTKPYCEKTVRQKRFQIDQIQDKYNREIAESIRHLQSYCQHVNKTDKECSDCGLLMASEKRFKFV